MIKKIVLTGGPCGGKTTSIEDIDKEFTEKGYQVIIVPEAATILINMGIKPFGDNAISAFDFQRYVIKLQLELEKLAENCAKQSPKDTILLCDRGIIDDKAYVTKNEYKALLKEFGMNEFEVMNRYDLVIHLRTAALGKEEFYTLDNNSARTETAAEAREKDEKTLEAWLGHEKLVIVNNDTNFQEKINRVIREVYEELGKPYPIQRQYKYLVESLDLDLLPSSKLVKLEIEQFIENEEGKDVMYRKTTRDGEVKYSIITKIDTDINSERITTKRNVDDRTYYDNINPDEYPIVKNRYCFEYQDQYFRLDIFDDGLKILELEKTNKSKKIIIPSFITVSDDITNNPIYRNSALYVAKNRKSITKNK